MIAPTNKSLPCRAKEEIVSVFVFAAAKKEKLRDLGNNKFEIFVKEPARKNMANRRVLQLLKEHFGAQEAQILTGHKSPKKKIQLTGSTCYR